MSKQTNLIRGVALALLTATISGVSIFYSKISLVKIDPLLLTTSRNLIVGLLFLILVIVTKKHKEIVRLTKKDSFMLILIGIIGGSVPFYLFFTGLKLIGAQQGNIIHKTLFIWVALLSFVFLREKVSLKLLFAGLLVLAGTYFFTPIRLVFGHGTQLILIADLLWAAETILAKKVMKNVSSELTGLSRMLLGGGLLAGLTLISGKGVGLLTLGIPQVSMILIGAGLLFFYVFTWYKALSAAPASVVTLILTWSLVVGNILNSAFANTRLTSFDWYSMVLLSGGATLAITSLKSISKKAAANENQGTHE